MRQEGIMAVSMVRRARVIESERVQKRKYALESRREQEIVESDPVLTVNSLTSTLC